MELSYDDGRAEEKTYVDVLQHHFEREVLVRGDGVQVLREGELGRRHLRRARDEPDRRAVAGARGDLLAVRQRRRGQGLSAEVDKVVEARQRRELAIDGRLLAVVLEAGLDDTRVES